MKVIHAPLLLLCVLLLSCKDRVKEELEITSADITDATFDPTNYKVVLYSGQKGLDTEVVRFQDGEKTLELRLLGLGVNRAVSIPDMSGQMAIGTLYDNETEANAALPPNVLYFNDSTGRFQITTK